MKRYLIRYKNGKTTSSYMPYLFKTKERAQQYINENTYFPEEFDVAEAIDWEDESND